MIFIEIDRNAPSFINETPIRHDDSLECQEDTWHGHYKDKAFDIYLAKPVGVSLAGHFRLKTVNGELASDKAFFMCNIPYSNVVGCLMYAMIGSRTDIAYGVSVVSRYMSKPSNKHWNIVKWLLRYLSGSIDCCIHYTAENSVDFDIAGYCDSDYAANLDKRRSLTGFIFCVGGNMVS
ncbi:secreted RxLR effector protein 161-like [Gastrolobium bilobum]|uniref:secreted RxLR effector protein 161-like n=1 Tax=Gastrolobium bilobum TaxID=150636 RepID=UPI002AB2E2E1|nr:secreted RxLR effector protein 161-like [Gastrolobium bilobum]